MSRYWNEFNCIDLSEEEYLEHFGTKGQKWGVRRYQNADGSLTAAGSQRYAKLANRYAKAKAKSEKFTNKSNKAKYKAGSIFSNTDKQLAKSAKYERKALRQTNKAAKQKRKLEKLMRKTNTSISEAYDALKSDPVAYERVKMMFA